MADQQIRDPLKDYLKAVNDQIAERVSVGSAATPYLLQQKAELEARLGLTKPEVKPEVKLDAEFEHKAEEPADETAVPRKPGRPRKPSDDDSPSGS